MLLRRLVKSVFSWPPVTLRFRVIDHAENRTYQVDVEEHDRRIYDATDGGEREVLPRVEYDALFEQCAES